MQKISRIGRSIDSQFAHSTFQADGMRRAAKDPRLEMLKTLDSAEVGEYLSREQRGSSSSHRSSPLHQNSNNNNHHYSSWERNEILCSSGRFYPGLQKKVQLVEHMEQEAHFYNALQIFHTRELPSVTNSSAVGMSSLSSSPHRCAVSPLRSPYNPRQATKMCGVQPREGDGDNDDDPSVTPRGEQPDAPEENNSTQLTVRHEGGDDGDCSAGDTGTTMTSKKKCRHHKKDVHSVSFRLSCTALRGFREDV